MKTRPQWLWAVLVWMAASVTWGQPSSDSATRMALESIFSPRRAPSHRTMGLVQRSFLDLVETSHPKLQVALVVDGTDSMRGELEGIRAALDQMVDDLQRYKESNVSFQLVIYRDAGSPSGPVSFPVEVPNRQFTSDRELLRRAIAGIEPETGAPYFPELIDLGIHHALADLDWSQDQDTTRWLLVFGDAPPFDEGFEEKEVLARRHMATDQLIATANRLGVQINCVLCTSREEDRQAYDQVLGKTQEFMNRLATETGGLMLDLSYPDIRNALQKAVQAQRVSYQRIGRITREDIQRARQAAAEQKSIVAENRRSRIAVLPHMSLDHLSFDPRLEEVQIAAELRHRLENIPGVEMSSPATVERQVIILRARGVRGERLLTSLATALKVDYIVWGELEKGEAALQVRTAIYDGVGGKQIVTDSQRTQPQTPVTRLTSQLAMNLIRKAVNQNVETRLVNTFNSLQGGARAQAAVVQPVARSAGARSDLLAGFETLQQALAHPVGNPQGDALLAAALEHLSRAVAPDADPSNPLAHVLLASCHFNLAASLAHQGKNEPAEAARSQAEEALRKAYGFRNEAEFSYVKQEIEADYALLVRRDYPAAVSIYEQLTGTSPDTPLHTALRAHWMLAGIYSGDWGVAQDAKGKELVDPARAREHLIQILAHWEQSSEAQFIRKNLRWDEMTGETRFEYFPQVTQPTADRLIES